MKRVILTSALIAAAAVLMVVLVMRKGGGAGDGAFSTGTDKGITRIVLERPGSRIVLENEKGEWVLNSDTRARMPAVMLIVAALEEMKPRSAVSADVFESLSSKSTGDPVKVTAFVKRKKITSFRVHHFTEPGFSSVLKKNPRSKPYLVYLPGYDFDPGMVFTTDLDYWKPFTLFEIMPSAIKEVKMSFTSDPGRSFTLINENGILTLPGIDTFDTVAVKRYLSYFVKIPFENLATDVSSDDEKAIVTGTPLFSLTVTTVNGESHILTGWSRSEKIGGNIETDTDRLWGKLDDGPLVVMRYLDIDPLLKKRSYFMTGK